MWLVADGYVNRRHAVAFLTTVFGTFGDYADVAGAVPALPVDGFREDFEDAADEDERSQCMYRVVVTSYDPVESVCEYLDELSRRESIRDRIEFVTALRYAPWLPLRSRLREMAEGEPNEELREICARRVAKYDDETRWRR